MARVKELEEQAHLKDEKMKDLEAVLFVIFKDIFDVNERYISQSCQTNLASCLLVVSGKMLSENYLGEKQQEARGDCRPK